MQKQQLSKAKSGVRLKLIHVNEPENVHVMRLCELGFVTGAALEIKKESASNMPVLVEINGMLMCVERSLADYFWVENAGARQ